MIDKDTVFTLAGFAKRQPALATVLVLAALVVFMAWAHFYGHARADDLVGLETRVSSMEKDLQQLSDDVRAGRREELENQLFEAKVKLCTAKSSETKQLYAHRIDDLLTKYREAGGSLYPLPDCEDLE